MAIIRRESVPIILVEVKEEKVSEEKKRVVHILSAVSLFCAKIEVSALS